MKAYYLVFALTLLISLFYNARTDVGWKRKLFWTFLPLFVFGAIRVDFGLDYSAYEKVFDKVHSHGSFFVDHDAHEEIGYQLLNWIMPTYRSLLVLTAFMLSLSLAVFCYHNIPKKYLWLAIILIFLNPEKNIYGILVSMRTGICVSSFLLGYVFVQKRKWLPFFLMVIAMMFIHTSSVVFMTIAYLLGSNKPFGKKDVWVWIGAIVVLLFLSTTQLFNVVAVLIDNDIMNRYEEVLSATSSHRGILQSITCVIIIVLLIVYFRTNSESLTPADNSLLRMGMLFAASLLLGSLSMRAAFFYDVFFIGSVVKVASDKKAAIALRLSLVAIAIASSCYSMYHVWMGAPWWNHAIYHSLLGNW